MNTNPEQPNDLPWLILTVGLPRSGKSTWARDYLDDVNACAIVNPDSIRKALGCYPFDAARESEVWHIARTMVKALFEAGHETVILDATNITRSRRAEWFSSEWNVEYMIFPTPVNVCKDRARASGQDYLLPVIERMADRADWQTEIDGDAPSIPFTLVY